MIQITSCSSHKGGKSESGTKKRECKAPMNKIIMYDRKGTRRATTKNNNDDK